MTNSAINVNKDESNANKMAKNGSSANKVAKHGESSGNRVVNNSRSSKIKVAEDGESSATKVANDSESSANQVANDGGTSVTKIPKDGRSSGNKVPKDDGSSGNKVAKDSKSSGNKILEDGVSHFDQSRLFTKHHFHNVFWGTPLPKYESIDFSTVNNQITIEHDEKFRATHQLHMLWLARWVLVFLIAFLVSTLVFCMHQLLNMLIHWKCAYLQLIAHNFPHNICITYLGWIGFGLIFMSVASGVCILFAKEAAGGSVAALSAYLNGTRMENLLTAKVVVVKIVSTIAQVCTATLGDKEGPIIHSAVAIGHMLPEFMAKIKYLSTMNKLYGVDERRDLAICGVAAGVSAAFGAPLAGTFLALEETTSFFNVELFSRIVACSFLSKMFLSLYCDLFDVILSSYPQKYYYKLQALFGELITNSTKYVLKEIVLYVLIGGLGAFFGTVFILLSKRILIWRQSNITSDWFRWAETLLNTSLISCFHITMMYAFSNSCLNLEDFSQDQNITLHYYLIPNINCPKNSIPLIGTFMTTFEDGLPFLMHTKTKVYSTNFLFSLFVFFFLFGLFSVGHSFSNGIFISHFILGALWGRIAGNFIFNYSGGQEWASVRKFAILGAAAQLTAVLRIEACIICIIMEATETYTDFLIPLVVTCTVAKYMAEWITPPFYHTEMYLMQIPFIEPHPPLFGSRVKVKELMTSKVISLSKRGTVRDILDTLSTGKGNYPVLNSKGKLLGDIAACVIYKIIFSDVHNENQPLPETKYETMYRILFSKDCSIAFMDKIALQVHSQLSDDDLQKQIDLTPFINLGPPIVRAKSSLSYIHQLFKQVGVRTVYVVDQTNIVIGVVTRGDITKYKAHFYLGKNHYEKMKYQE